MIQSLEDLIVPGRVLRLFCSFTDPPKDKYVVIVATKPFCLGLLISSELTDLQKSKSHLLDEIIPISKADGYNFLTNTSPSFLDCTVAHDIDLAEILVQIGQKQSRLLCIISQETRDKILKVVGESLMLEGGIAKIITKGLATVT